MARFLHFVTKLALVLCIGIAFPAATGAEDSGEAMNADGSESTVDPATTSVAVIGGGIAGATTILELIGTLLSASACAEHCIDALKSQGFQDITLIERNSDLLQSTSSMIAATVNFDSMFRDDWKGVAGIAEAWSMTDQNEETQIRKVFRLSRQRLIHLGLDSTGQCAKFMDISENEDVDSNGETEDISTGCDDETILAKEACEDQGHVWTDI
eukprot:gene19382-15205_t